MTARFPRNTSALVFALGLATSAPRAGALEFLYDCWDGAEGILMRFDVDPASGRFTRHDRVWSDRAHMLVDPLGLTADGRHAVLLSVDEDGWGVIGVDLNLHPPQAKIVVPTGRPEFLAMHGRWAIYSDNVAGVHLFDPAEGRVVRSLDLRAALDPPGYRIGALATVPGKDRLLVLFHADDREGRRRGNRLIVVSLPDLRLLHDLRLPRTLPQLHYPGEHPQRGPVPVRIVVAPREDRLVLACDLYGAVALTGLGPALEGRWEGFVYVPTSTDGAWGTSFPVEAGVCDLGGRDLLWAANATASGHLALIDPGTRRLLDCPATGAGALETAAFLPDLRALFFFRSGRVRARGVGEVTEHHTDSHDLVAVDLGPIATGGRAGIRVAKLPGVVYQVAAVAPAASPLLLVGVSPPPPPHRDHYLCTVDGTSLETLDRIRAPGVLRHIVPAGPTPGPATPAGDGR